VETEAEAEGEDMFQLDPKLPFAAFVNPKIAFTQSQGIPYQYNQIVASFPGDPLVGQKIPTTELEWNKTTETQGLIFEYYQALANSNPSAQPWPADFEKTLNDNAGPAELWNYSYEQWGVVPGVTGSVKTLYTAVVGTGQAVTVIVP
jgi:hypothetical protein